MAENPMYEPFAREYATHAAQGSYNALYDRPAVLQLAEPVMGRTVLDAGCGPGLYAAEFLRRGARVIGFDQSPTLIELARQRVGDAASSPRPVLGSAGSPCMSVPPGKRTRHPC